MFPEIMNLYTDESLSGMYVSAYINSLARHHGTAVTVWRGAQTKLRSELLRLSHMMRLATLQGAKLPRRRVYIYNLDPYEDAVHAIRFLDPSVSIQKIDMVVPHGYLVQLKAALGIQSWEDVESLCAQKLFMAMQGRWEEVDFGTRTPPAQVQPLPQHVYSLVRGA